MEMVLFRQGPHLSIRIGIWILPSDLYLVMTWTVFVLTIQIERRQCYLVLFTELLSHSPIVSIDFTDVTLVSEDTYGDNEVGGDEENYKGEEG